MESNAAPAITFVLSKEGGYVNDPNDPGGETKYGISKRAYPDLDIANLTESEAMVIYRRDYWDRCGCDYLSPGLDICVFDTAVNMGRTTAIRILEVSIDYDIYLWNRLTEYNKIVTHKPVMKKFFLGWVRRVLDLRAEAIRLEAKAH